MKTLVVDKKVCPRQIKRSRNSPPRAAVIGLIEASVGVVASTIEILAVPVRELSKMEVAVDHGGRSRRGRDVGAGGGAGEAASHPS